MRLVGRGEKGREGGEKKGRVKDEGERKGEIERRREGGAAEEEVRRLTLLGTSYIFS